MKKIQSIILFSIIFTLITISTTFTVLAENPNTLKPKIDPNIITRGTPALLFTIEDVLTDTIFSFESFKGKVVVLDFFSTTCEPCEYSIPELKNAKAKYSSDDLEIISIDVDLNDTETDIEHFASENGISWKMVSDTLGINTYYQLITIPTFYVIDQDQYIYQAIFGLYNFDELDGFILELLPEYSSSPNPSNGNGTPSEFWGKNWYWFLLSGVIFVIVTGLVIQRRRIVLHNRKVRAQKMDARQRRVRKRER
ncbi:MAG: TlpA family protein disulfide reductase [Asgard group archaeon]|nr:TlpA family protein disulfide reductase [Asgard group archaeon]